MQCIACPSITFFRYHAYCCAQIMGWKKMKMKTEDWWVEKVCWTSLLGLPLVLATDTLCDVHVGYYTSVHLRNGILMRSCALMSNHTDAKWRWIADRENDIMQYYTRITETTEFVQKQTKRNRIIQSNNIIFFIHFFPKLKCINQHDFYLTESKKKEPIAGQRLPKQGWTRNNGIWAITNGEYEKNSGKWYTKWVKKKINPLHYFKSHETQLKQEMYPPTHC